MGKRLKELCDWVESLGYSSQGWLGGDWQIPLHLLSKLMYSQLEQRRKSSDNDCGDDVTLKISFDTLLELAEHTLGVPVLIMEKDLLTRHPNLHLALLTYLVCLRTTADYVDPKQIRNSKSSRLIYEAKNGLDASLPSCPDCNQHVFIIERVVIERVVYHRQCLKCVECGSLLSRGAFKKTKVGFECISHAVRKILDANESVYSSGSGTYDRYGFVKSPRPAVAPPPRPKPKVPPKPASISRKECDYETLDEIQASISKAEPNQTKSLPPDDHYDEVSETVRTSSDCGPAAANEDKTSHKGVASADEQSSADSVDSGVVIRMAKMFTESESGRDRIRTSQPVLASPVAPPRPKRTSMLISSCSRSHSASPSLKIRTPSKPQVANNPFERNLNIEDYPGYLCPFGEDDESIDEVSAYPSSKNPFADSDDESNALPPVPAPRVLPPPLPSLPGTSDRPKRVPPPPPNGASIVCDTASAPPKPARNSLNPGESRIHTLRVSRKSFRAPLPPVPHVRKINFTEEGVKMEPDVISKRLKEIEEQMKRIEMEGRAVEKEMLFHIETNPRSWWKSARADDWVEIVSKKLDLMREQLYLLGLWRENYLNEVHGETEYYIRCLLEKERDDKSEWEMERESTLTNLLIYIIDEKLKLDEYMGDLNGGSAYPKEESAAKADQKKKKLKKRVFVLSKRLKAKTKS